MLGKPSLGKTIWGKSDFEKIDVGKPLWGKRVPKPRFWKTDFGKPVDNMTTVKPGVGYKNFEKGLVAYNRTSSSETFLVNGTQITLGALEGLFQSK